MNKLIKSLALVGVLTVVGAHADPGRQRHDLAGEFNGALWRQHEPYDYRSHSRRYPVA